MDPTAANLLGSSANHVPAGLLRLWLKNMLLNTVVNQSANLISWAWFFDDIPPFRSISDQKSGRVRCVSFNQVHLKVIFATGLAPKGPEERQKDLELSPVPTYPT